MTPEEKERIHNEIAGMFKGLGSRRGNLRQWYNGKGYDKRSKQPTNERR
jgi:hypothetical protein